MGNKNYLTLEQACKCLLEQVSEPEGFDTVSLLHAAGRISREPVRANIYQPPFDRSPLDGYAVNSRDIKYASKESPAVLRVVQNIFAGDMPTHALSTGEAAQVMTGAPLPPGADCVVRQEDSYRNGEKVSLYVSHKKNENICFKGEDVCPDTLLLMSGQKLDSIALSILAGQGLGQVKVFPKPIVGILSTGSELTEPGKPLTLGKIYDSNRVFIETRVQALGGFPLSGGCAADDPQHLAAAVQRLLDQSDFVITTGGVSVGAHDYMTKVGDMLGARLLFHGVEMKPGSPALALEKDNKLILCLSGNPFAAAATFELLAVPVLKKLSGHSKAMPKRLKGILRNPFHKASYGRRFIRAKMTGGDVFIPENHASGCLSSMADCNCLIDIPTGSPPLNAGAEVEVIIFQ